ncbi:hypothetical protein [Piscirickettsia salmonis]|uniref:hypothetical protein n=1 Tax=Piscirickettsia salmonis TaxID=1238 RepID=UPI00030DBB4D|nr:hypothetical protein [Piscirickettsia salmonis]APS59022.1 DNA-binding protein [Piscirickettsia salmonis]APS59124.1 DNA-binding protein [Piscirickettsia salmonis]ERL61130.1 transcriptional regulator, XRE family domain protein [Piscirickettsia salmonis LF-89 = ATCC VR-1361]PEQ15936.1 DNA-binding protein [Piscirickettsia salmonis]QGN79313.1 hypothetical protein Psal001_03578 [Piscirickettsia salmonis]
MSKNLIEALHETAKDFHDAGVISEQIMREFDAMCLSEVKGYTPNQIKQASK